MSVTSSLGRYARWPLISLLRIGSWLLHGLRIETKVCEYGARSVSMRRWRMALRRVRLMVPFES